MAGKRIWAVAVLAAALLAGSGTATADPAWTTYRHDAARSGIDPDSTSPLPPAFAWQTQLDGKVYGQPLVYGADVYVATENDTIYALAAASGAVVWSRHLATPESASAAPCGDISPTIGVTSTPVIDPATGLIYAVGAVTGAGGAVSHQLFALDVSTGAPAAGFPISADPPLPASGSTVNQLQRPALALQSGRVLVGYGGNDGDCNTYWGWLVSLPENPPGPELAFQADSGTGHDEGAIWGAGSGPPVDAAGHAWVATGNGNSGGSFDFAESVIGFDASLTKVGYWAPTNWQSLDSSDADIGSSEPALLPGNLIFEAGKDGNAYLINGASPGGISAPAAQLNGFCSGGSFGGAIYAPGTGTIYAACNGGLRALTLGTSPPALAAKAGFSAPSDANGPPMLAGGLVWATAWNNGKLYGLDPGTGHAAFTYSLSAVEHFATPSAGGGRLFLGAGSQVDAFTIATPPATTTTSTTSTTTTSTTTSGSSSTTSTSSTTTSTTTAAKPPPRLRITQARLSPSQIRRGRSTTLRLRLSRAITITITITRHGRHRAAWRRRVHLRAGRHALRLRVGGLIPGRYTLRLSAPGTRTVTLGLRVLPRR